MHYEIMTVTPELAQRWLSEKNKRNRNLSKITVDAYVSDMQSGKWRNSHQNAIAFYKDGNLADGQHRLAAIAASGVSIDFMVWWGLDDQDAYGIDAHKMRNTHDQIKIAGGADWITKDVIAIARMMMVQTRATKKHSPQEVVEFCQKHEGSLRFTVHHMPKSIFSAPVKVSVAIAYYHERHNDLIEWCDVMRTGIGSSQRDRSAIVFRERMIRDPNLKSQGGAAREIICRLAMRSIHAFCANSVLSKIVEPKERIYVIPA